MPVPYTEKQEREEGTEIALENDVVRVELLPSQGGRIQKLRDRRSDRELLWQAGAPAPWPREDFLDGCPGGWDAIFPNDAPFDGLPDHGVLWSTAFELADRSERHATLRTQLSRPPVAVEQRVELLEDGRAGVRVATTLTASGETGPLIAASHPLLAVEAGWTILARGGSLRADTGAPGRFDAGATLEGQDRERALTVEPPGVDGWEVMFLTGADEATAASPDGRRRTRVRWPEGYEHLWIVRTGEGDTLTLQLEPSTSSHYTVEEGTPFTLAAGESRRLVVELESLDGAP